MLRAASHFEADNGGLTHLFPKPEALATADPRAPEEVAHWRARDPIQLFGQRLTGVDLAAIEAEERRRIDEAVQFALNSPPPDPAEAYTDVLA